MSLVDVGIPKGFGDSTFAEVAKGLKGTGAVDADVEASDVFANGLIGAGEGDLLNGPTFSVADSVNRTCLLLCKVRGGPLTAEPLRPLCSRLAAFSSRSCSNWFGGFALEIGPVNLTFE